MKRSLEEANEQAGLLIFTFLCSGVLLVMEDTETKNTVSFMAGDPLGIICKIC